MSKQTNANEGAVCFRTSIGGQALLEGILMRGPQKQAIVCRTPDGLVEKVDELHLVKDKQVDQHQIHIAGVNLDVAVAAVAYMEVMRHKLQIKV